MNNKWIRIISIVIGIPTSVVIFIIIRIVLDDMTPFDNLKFSKQAWASASGFERQDPQGQMTDDLLHHYLHKGQTYEEVVDLIDLPRVPDQLHRWGFNTLDRVFISTLSESDKKSANYVLQVMVGKDYSYFRSIDHVFMTLYFDDKRQYLGGILGSP